jgi:hypothetical protein
MAVYVVLLFDLEDSSVVSADTVDARSSEDACDKAAGLLKATSDADGYEIWLDGVKIASWFPGRGPHGHN